MKKRFRPRAPASQPLIGRMMAFETKYEVNTHVLWSLLAPRFPAMYGRATLAMLVSRTSMNAAIATTTAISQGLYLGRQTSCSIVSAAELIRRRSLNGTHWLGGRTSEINIELRLKFTTALGYSSHRFLSMGDE